MAEDKMETAVGYEYDEYKESFPYSSAVEIVEVVSEIDLLDEGRDAKKPNDPRSRLMKMLDNLEDEVEGLRKNAMALEDKKETLLGNLDIIRQSQVVDVLNDDEKKEIEDYIDMISCRCKTVQIKVNTMRDQQQEESLHNVNSLIDSMVLNLQSDPLGTRGRCLSYLSSFYRYEDDNEVLVTIASKLQPMHADKGFENALLGCTLDDQKSVKRRLRGLLSYITNL
ncbi:BAG family molecular chaperone regulator 2 [Neocloeon triangulifer]|uniref:BAG family molecular chaperone regulator 2 n=1 Tax=Neocloeon triangulifer TaxID=2078957 RepID=UPI00286F8D25|nr:BAG family molecular chaperone regulator 2 [Neocloeon triangulifer]